MITFATENNKNMEKLDIQAIVDSKLNFHFNEHIAIFNDFEKVRSLNISDVLIEEIGNDGSESGLQVPMFDPATPMPTKMIDGDEYIGILEIPSLGITLPVMADWDLTLFTCNAGGQTRCAVRCSRIE